ncbi:hypothetical protein Syun_005978 [Stephania yunnanensis]|uniref:Uncharacterized protein n=1 Tax=Stephania yunnanensis TaxID=152371 RepID=A0AAP0PX46_9MAGN
MATPHPCSDTSSDTNQMHHIAFGLYVAGATLVCSLGILFDIFFGVRSRKRWLPCRFFSLNSITLTLLSGALKLSVEISTKMPSAEDQLSKLTGTTMLCICMAFLLPSLGINSDHEWWSNMAAMSILVATVVANIGIQLKTGVIFAFHVEHIIILCIMLLLLLMMWFSAYEINTLRRNFMIQNRRIFSQGDRSMFERLKLGYLNYYNSNPQLLLYQNMSASRINSERKNKFAKALSRGRGFKSIEEKILKNAQLRNICSNLPRALKVIKELKDAMPNDIVKEEVRVITDFINRHGYKTMEDLQNYMERLFADMMNKFLVQFPNAIYRELTECYLEEYEEKVRKALTLICRVEPLIKEKLVQWSFPSGTNITALMTSDEFPSCNNKKATEGASNNQSSGSLPPPPQVIDRPSCTP